MLLFKSILREEETSESARPERRREQRFPIPEGFPLKTVLNYIGRDDTGAPLSRSRHGWNWKGRVIDLSNEGARLMMGPGLKPQPGESCELKLTIQNYELTIPCHLANRREHKEGTIFGLKHDIEDEAVRTSYHQLVEVLALGSSLRPRFKKAKPDASGYLVEQFANDRPARLTVWRDPASAGVVAFEFLLKDSGVQAATGESMEYLAVSDTGVARHATPARANEIHRLFTWVVPSLPPSVPDQVREFLQEYA
jgi:hypothetical protein